jgi:hypothetical protein
MKDRDDYRAPIARDAEAIARELTADQNTTHPPSTLDEISEDCDEICISTVAFGSIALAIFLAGAAFGHFTYPLVRGLLF